MKIKNLILTLSLLLTTTGCTLAQPAIFQTKPWNATVKVVGEDRLPISKADVSVAYTKPPYAFSDDENYHGIIWGTTDRDGTFSATHDDRTGMVGFSANKQGYYQTRWSQELRDPSENTGDRNITVTLLLKKIANPTSMYAKKIDSFTFPAFNKPIGYDFTIGDWIAPYGKGVNSDVFFTENHPDEKSGYTFTISFPNPEDGIQGFTRDWSQGVSGLLSSHEAPLDGYQPKYEQTQMPSPDRIYYFRVRTKVDDRGNIVSAHYGKIYGDIPQFTYYLNPTPNQRNIEFDPKQNLIHDLQPIEQVTQP